MKKTKLVLLLLVLSCLLCACKSSDYRKANSLFENGDYEEAYNIYQSLGEYKDTAELSNECQYQIAKNKLNLHQYDDAKEIFTSLCTYKDSSVLSSECTYQKVLTLIEQRDFYSALNELTSISDYKDSAELILLTNNWIVYQQAQQQIQKRNYDEALELLSQIKGFQDVDTILSRFTTETLLTSESYTIFDNLGNRRKARIEYEYNEKGQLVSADSATSNRLAHFSRHLQSFANDPYSISNASKELYEYNENGTIHSILGFAGSSKSYFVQFNYDQNGKIEYEDATTNTDEGKCYYLYNDKGQLTGVQLDRNTSPIMHYSYDDTGKIIKAESTAFGKMFTMNYNYDGELLVSKEVSILGSDYLTEHYIYGDNKLLEKVEYEYSDSRNGRIEIVYRYNDFVFYQEA